MGRSPSGTRQKDAPLGDAAARTGRDSCSRSLLPLPVTVIANRGPAAGSRRRAAPRLPFHLMHGSREILIQPLDLEDDTSIHRLLEVQRAAHQIEASLIGFDKIPGLEDSVETLRRSGEAFIGAYVEGALAGAASYKVVDDTIDIHRLVVHPQYFRQGIASRLLDAVENEGAARRVIVSTGSDNEPARLLYGRRGYGVVDTHESAPSLSVTRFEKKL